MNSRVGSNWRRYLTNPMLYKRLFKRLTGLNAHIDPAIIDTSLEYTEALKDIARHHPEIRTGKGDDEPPSLLCCKCSTSTLPRNA